MEGRCREPWQDELPENLGWCSVPPGPGASSDGAEAVLLCLRIVCGKDHSYVAELSHYPPTNQYEMC